MNWSLDDSLLHRLVTLALRFGALSIFSVGTGATGMIPQMHFEFVLRDRWLDETTFTQLLAVSQAAPGPNFLIVSLIGWRIASWPGAFVVLCAFLALPNAIALTVGRLLRRHDSPLLAIVRRAVRPMAVALWIATGTVIAFVNDKTPAAFALTGVVAALSVVLDLNPLWWCLGAGIAGALLF